VTTLTGVLGIHSRAFALRVSLARFPRDRCTAFAESARAADDLPGGEIGAGPRQNDRPLHTGGTEQRGPQNGNGGHNLIAKAAVRATAATLGNAVAMPVLPITPNSATAELPGTIGLTKDIPAAVLERVSDQAIVTGFRNVILMGDHGGGQPNVYRAVAKKLGDKYAPQGIHVYYCDDVYFKGGQDFDAWLASQGYPHSVHGGVPDTSEMMYLGGDTWVRKNLTPTVLGDQPPPAGKSRTEQAAPPINNGITGDARRSSAALGKMLFDMKVDYAAKQIQGFLGQSQQRRSRDSGFFDRQGVGRPFDRQSPEGSLAVALGAGHFFRIRSAIVSIEGDPLQITRLLSTDWRKAMPSSLFWTPTTLSPSSSV
jgi:creatinine amidohydrolase/Fe(II)-dependent formamide hydrolase-like protein